MGSNDGDDQGSKTPATEFDLRASMLRRKMESAAREIAAIVLQGRQAAKDASHKPRFMGMYKCLEKYFTKYEVNYEELGELYLSVGSDAFPSKDDSTGFDTYRRYYYEAHTLHEGFTAPTVQLIQSGGKGKGGGASSPQETTIKVDTSIPSTNHLPKLTIPRFNGEFTGWPRFRDSFKSIIHEDASIPDITKFHYLVTSLGPTASAVINHLPLLEDNYPVAWQALLTRYDNKRILAATYLNTILDSTPMSSNPSNEALTEFMAKIVENVSAFRLLKIPKEADFILYYLTFRCLDKRSREQFEIRFKDTPYPTFEDLSNFIREHCTALQLADFHSLKIDTATTAQPRKGHNYNTRSTGRLRGNTALLTNRVTHNGSSRVPKPKGEGQCPIKPCYICTRPHKIIDCPNFISANAYQRRNLLNGFTGCYNCLGSHLTKNCPSSRSCKFCSLRHHSMIHSYNPTPDTANSATYSQSRHPTQAFRHQPFQTTQGSTSSSETPQNSANLSVNAVSCRSQGVLLGTAVVDIKNKRNIGVSARVVVDSGSQCTLVTSRLIKKLGLPISKFKQTLSGIGQTPFSNVLGKALCTITPTGQNDPKFTTEALVVETITSNLPNFSLSKQWIKPYLNYDLADPTFWQPGEIDALIGADLFAQVLSNESIKIKPDGPVLVSSVFGYLVMGAVPIYRPDESLTNLFVSSDSTNVLQDDLRKFWEIEDCFADSKEAHCPDSFVEDYFMQTHSRNDEGRYIIRLPFTGPIPEFKDSASIALKRFRSVETKLSRDPDLRAQYVAFMNEYHQLGHMNVTTAPSKFVLPHHAVMKEGKIRVVFDASASSSHGSLNQYLRVGPKLQKDIKIVILKFRKHKAVFVTDIVKMYRQILIHPSDTSFQHIFWRSDPTLAIQKFSLETLTYGMSCSPFQAQRVIQQLCIDEGQNFPAAADAVSNDIYIDDLVTGADSLHDALELQRQTIDLLKRGGFQLSKWSSNFDELIPDGTGDSQPRPLSSDEEAKIKILGLQWNPKDDTFGYKITKPNVPETKRGLLSAIARIYDPLGWLSPTVVLAKGLIQDLWKVDIDWDENIPPETQSRWLSFIEELPTLSQVSIPRHIIPEGSNPVQIVGFCDASMKAYSATLYLKIVEPYRQVFLLTARTKLAPLKTISIPRLELCGALLLARTYASIQPFITSISVPLLDPLFFTDSQIVLSWLNTEPYVLKTFVANRVSEVTSTTPAARWHHVNSKENPSDISSRGMLPNQLITCELWWSGPEWLKEEMSNWPISRELCPSSELPELKPEETSALHTIMPASPLIEWMERLSSYKRIVRILGWVHRFLCGITPGLSRKTGPLSLKEINMGLSTCIRAVQAHYFFEGNLPEERCIPAKFANLSPYLDEARLLRVGGRLARSSLPEYSKHPILLPGDCHFTRMLVDHYHQINLHPGPALLQALIQRRYWIPSLRRISRKRTFLCVKCYRSKASNKPVSPIMSDLPSARVQRIRPFLRTGVDFAGPFALRHSLLRKPVISKLYLCVFICMATKAVHLEAVTDLTTNAFLACLSRFAARRGFPEKLFSDCGTNFVGAANHLNELRKWLQSRKTQDDVCDYAANHGFTWSFNVPSGPHHGGLWEAAVKSAKTIIRKIAGDTALTLEEWSTLFTKVESILNSRPLCPISTSPEETDFLSPGHFLIGDHLVTPPGPSLAETPMNRLSRWELVKKMADDFWKKWALEYLTTLQQRAKWTDQVSNVQVGDLLLLREKNSPPRQWPLGRVVDILPGKDGVVRVVRIRIGTTEHLRPVHKLVPLRPLQEDPFAGFAAK